MFFQDGMKDNISPYYAEHMYNLHELSNLIDWSKDSQEDSPTTTSVLWVILS